MNPDAATAVSAPAAGLGDEILAKARTTMAEKGLDVLVAMSPENLAYISGAAPPSQRTVRSRHAAAIVPQDGGTEVITVALEAPLVQSQSRLDQVTAYEEFVEDPIEVIASSLSERGLSDARVGIETTYLSVADHETLTRALPRAQLRPIDEMLSTMRMVKTRSEIEAIRTIGAAADRIAAECVALVRAGDTERDLANLITERYLEAGGDQFTMLVVGSGPRSAHPNAPATGRTMEPGDVVRLDLIGTSRHYYSDVARTAMVGEPAGEPARIYDLLMSVHERLLAALRPGASSSAVFAIYADAMTEAGLPAYHFVGHGLGVTLHEEPFISASTTVELQEDMVLCIEPLTMLADRFGVQIEDEILITADGCEPFTRARGLLTIPA